MENPATWNLLTGLLSGCDLDDPDATWARLRRFKVMAGEGAPALAAACAALQAQAPGLVGRSGASQVASALAAAGVVTPRGLQRDPNGRKAAAMLRGRWLPFF